MIKKGVIYFVVITLLMYAVRYLHYEGLLKTKGYYEHYKTAFFEKNDFNVVFLGSSRVEMHYDTRLFDSLTHQNSFSLNMMGATPMVAFVALKTYLSQSKAPEYLIYEVDYHSVNFKSTEIREFNNYFPFLRNPVFRHEAGQIDPRMRHFYYDPYFSLPFTGFRNLSTGLHGWLHIPNKTDSLYHKGFFREVLRPNLDYMPLTRYHAFFEVTQRNYLDSIILLCKKKNIKVSLMSSPVFGGGKVEINNKEEMIRQISNIATIHGIGYFDLSSLPFCNQRNLFIDHYHLNYAGAEKFGLYLCRVFNNKIMFRSLKYR